MNPDKLNQWLALLANVGVLIGLLSEATRRGVFYDIDVVIAEMPGLIPAFEYLFEGYRVDEEHELETMAYLFKAVKRHEQEYENSPDVPAGVPSPQ